VRPYDAIGLIVCALIIGLTSGILTGYHAGKEACKRQMVHCDEKIITSNEKAFYICLPVNQ